MSYPKDSETVVLEVSYASCSKENEFNKLLKIAERGCLSVNTIKVDCISVLK